MAYLINPEDELSQNGQQVQQSSKESNIINPGTSGTNTNVTQTKNNGSGWTNLNQYLNVNKGQASGLANDLSKDVNSKVDSFKAIDSSGAVNEINKAAENDTAKNIQSNIVQNAGQAKDFLSKQVNVNPNDYTAGVRSQGSQIKDTLEKVDNQQFQQGQLQKIYGQRQPTQPNQGQYTSGFGALDSFLLFGDEESKGKLQQVKARKNEVDNKVQDYSTQIDNAVSSTRDQLAKNQAAVRDAAKGQYNSIYSGAQSRIDAVKSQQRKDAENKAAEIFAKKKDEYAGFINDGTDGDQGVQFIKGNDKFGVNNVVNDEEVAALNALAGIDAGLGLGTITKDNSSAVNFDAGGWESLLSGLGSKRKADKEEADRQEAIRKENERLQKILDEQRARDEASKAAESRRIETERAAERERIQNEERERNKVLEKQAAVMSKAGAVGGDISDISKQIINAPSDLFNTLIDSVQYSTPAQKLNTASKNLKKGKIRI